MFKYMVLSKMLGRIINASKTSTPLNNCVNLEWIDYELPSRAKDITDYIWNAV